MVVSVQTSLLDVGALVPYEFNPRDNKTAIVAVTNSIREFGFLVPIVVDSNNVIVAGHTRWAAIQQLITEDPAYAEAYKQIPVIVAEHLTEDQLRAFRLIDNKTAELATWDFALLSQEISYLHETGVDFQQFGWSQEEVDCLSNVVSSDCLTSAEGAAFLGDMDPSNLSSKMQGRSFSESKDGVAIRVTFGDLAFYVMRDDYSVWMNALMKENEFDPMAVVERVAAQMGLLEAKLKRDAVVRVGDVSPEAEELLPQEVAPEYNVNPQ